MKPRVFIVHRWDGSFDEPLYRWLEKNLDKKGYEVKVLEMPNPEHPAIETWVQHLLKAVGHSDESTHFIGHSVGCQTILRYLQELPSMSKVGKIVLIAPWIHLQGIEKEGPEVKKIAKPWLETPINWKKIIGHTENFVCIFSDNDYYVSLSDAKIFKSELRARIIIEKNKGHFTEDDGVKKLPSVVKEF